MSRTPYATSPRTALRCTMQLALAAACALAPALLQAQTKPVPGPTSATKASPKAAAKPSAAPSSETLVEQARSLLTAGQAVQAMSVARQAALQAPNDYRPPYYLALALLMLGETAGASEAQARSTALSTNDAARDAVAQLGQRIKGQQLLLEADAALSEGLYAKATGLLQRAWQAGALTPARQLGYAELLLERQSDLAAAAGVLRELSSKHLGTPEAEVAMQKLQALTPRLRQQAQEQVAAARRSGAGTPARLAGLRRALELDADSEVAAVLLADTLAAGRDWAELRPALLSLHRKQWLQGALERRWLTLDGWQDSAELIALLSEIWGPERATQLLRAGLGGGYEKMEAESMARAKAQAQANAEQAQSRYRAREEEIYAAKSRRQSCVKSMEVAEYGEALTQQLYYSCKKSIGTRFSNQADFARRMSECIDPVQARWQRSCEARHPVPEALPYPK